MTKLTISLRTMISPDTFISFQEYLRMSKLNKPQLKFELRSPIPYSVPLSIISPTNPLPGGPKGHSQTTLDHATAVSIESMVCGVNLHIKQVLNCPYQPRLESPLCPKP